MPRRKNVTPAPGAEYTGPDHLTTLPPELLHEITQGVAEGDDMFSELRHRNLASRARASKALNAVATPALYENIVLGFSPQRSNGLGREPIPWVKPPELRLLEHNGELAKLVKRVQVRVEPFPVSDAWEDDNIRNILREASVGGHKPRFTMDTDLNMDRSQVSSGVSGRQTAVVSAYAHYFGQYYGRVYANGVVIMPVRDRVTGEIQPLAADLTATVTKSLQLLPGLQYIEGGQWRRQLLKGHYDKAMVEYEKVSLAYANALALTCAPVSVLEARIRTYMAPTAGRYKLVDGNYNTYALRSTDLLASRLVAKAILNPTNPRLARLPLLANITSLRVDIGNTMMFHRTAGNRAEALQSWSKFLTHATSVRQLTLCFADPKEFELWHGHAQDLYVLCSSFRLDNVTVLELRGWVVRSCHVEGLLKATTFPALAKLRLTKCIVYCDTEAEMELWSVPEEIWDETMKAVVSGIKVDVEQNMLWHGYETKSEGYDGRRWFS